MKHGEGTVTGGRSTSELEVDLLLEGVFRCYGYDFRDCSRPSVARHLWRRARLERVPTISALQDRLLHDPESMERLLRDLSADGTAMFRDATFFRSLRTRIVPLLRTYPFVRVWDAGCGTGEETWSLAILLHEAGLLERCRIYATDVNEAAVDQARRGEVALDQLQAHTEAYHAAGCTRTLSEYYTALGEVARFERTLTDNVVFAPHDLVQDRSFNEFQLVVCPNVLIYYDRPLQRRVLGLFDESLVRFGILALGHRASLASSPRADDYEVIDSDERLYRKWH